VSALFAAFDPKAFRWGSSSAPLLETVVIVSVIAALAVACALIFRHQRRRARPKRVVDQWQALAVMGELCPHGWRAQITVYGSGAPLPADAPAARVPPVELEWTRFDARSRQVAVPRRRWASTIRGALQAMVEDRRTDLTLEQIERATEEHDALMGRLTRLDRRRRNHRSGP